MSFAANSAWFMFSAEGGAEFSVLALSGSEHISEPFQFNLQLICTKNDVCLTDMLGKKALLTICDQTGYKRCVHGCIHRFEYSYTGNTYSHYECVIVPRFTFLEQTNDHRIFQNKNVLDIIDKILKEHIFTGEDYKIECSNSYPPREYCVQYNETDAHFISRLCEEEGIYYYFSHSDSGHCMHFADKVGGKPIPGNATVRYYVGSGMVNDEPVIKRLQLNEHVCSNTVEFKDWNFETPELNLASREEGDTATAPVGIDLEVYHYPHLFQDKGEGKRYATLQMKRQTVFKRWIDAEADIARFLPGSVFSIKEHPRKDINAEWLLTSVQHGGEQPQALEYEGSGGMYYGASITAIPSSVPYTPAKSHTKPRIIGQQTAIVTGPKGEEIFPDKYGRVKVQFHWDREGKYDDWSSCWIRVSQGWAGSQFGTMAIPRVGQEVIVSFLEGDPDRPIITGRVYNEKLMPSYQLPENKTRTVFKSESTPGEEGEERGFNELRIEDKKGVEEVYFHAEKDVNVYVKNDWKEHILHDKHETIDNQTMLWTKGETHEILEKDRKTELKESDYLTIRKEHHMQVDEKWLTKVGDEVHIKAGTKIVFEAGVELTIKGAGSSIKLDPSGVWVNGAKIGLNAGGGPGSGSGVDMKLPDETTSIEKSPAPVAQAIALKNAAKAGKMFCPVC